MLEVFLLGPVEVLTNGVDVPLAPLERNLLALLALSPRTVLSTERIIDGLWGERPPAAPRSRVQGLVSTLRRKLGDVLVTRHPGYLLAEGVTDLSRCEDLAREARTATAREVVADRLRRALGLWRGEPLEGVTAPGLDADRTRLTELHVGLLEERFEAELGLGHHAGIVGDLFAAVAAHPLRERLAGQLMLALFRCNRQADALRAYQALRARLAEELGGDPCADVRELHAMILRGKDPGSPPEAAAPEPRRPDPAGEEHRPAQMPASVGHFTGREDELAALTAALPGTGEEPRVLLVSGAGGLGKTALVVRWAHAVADRFPDGQIFVELRGAGLGAATSPGSALGSVLLALGVSAEQLPVSAEERAAMYRTLVHGRRVLVVADDAATVAQLLPLVPPTAGSMVVATSRNRLSALTAHHEVHTLALQPLDTTAAYTLLRAIVGTDRLQGKGTGTVIELCGGWPLALRLAGATLAARPRQSLASFAAELDERVDVLSIADDPRTVRAALAEQHAGLDPAAARLFAQLGLLPGATVCLPLAASAAGISVLRARRLLDELISANLVVETGPDRYWLHDMIRRYAAHLGRRLSDRPVVEERVMRWYLAVFDGLAHRLDPERDRPPVGGRAEWTPFDGDGAQAERFLEEESPNLPAVLRWVASHGDHRLTWHLVSLVHASGAGLPAETAELGLTAALALCERRATGEAHARLGSVLLRDPCRLDEADRHLSVALEILDAEDGRLPATASYGLGLLRARQGRLAEALSAMEYALRHLDPGREPFAYAVALLGYAEALARSGEPELGQERFAQAMILCQAVIGARGDRSAPFVRAQEHLDQQVAAAFIARLDDAARAQPAPHRLTVPDRALARTLIDFAQALRHRDVAVGTALPIPDQAMHKPGEQYFAMQTLNTADVYRI